MLTAPITRRGTERAATALFAASLLLSGCQSETRGGSEAAKPAGGPTSTASVPIPVPSSEVDVTSQPAPFGVEKSPAAAPGSAITGGKDSNVARPESNPNAVKVTAGEALAWWPWRPVLRSLDRPETFYRIGKTCDPSADYCGSLVVMHRPAGQGEPPYFQAIREGAVGVAITRIKDPSQFVPPPSKYSDPVTVRGVAGVHMVMTREEEGPYLRVVFWTLRQPNGDTLVFQAQADPNRFTEASILSHIDGLSEQ